MMIAVVYGSNAISLFVEGTPSNAVGDWGEGREEKGGSRDGRLHVAN